MTLLDSLLALSPYPLDPEAVRLKAWGRGLDPDAPFCPDEAGGRDYLLARADVLMLLAFAPNVTQEGVSYDILYSVRQQMQAEADKIYRRYLPADDPDRPKARPRYGYAGSLLKR